MQEIDQELRIKEVGNILRHEIRNWVRWGRRRDYLPPSFKCVLGALRIHERIPLGDERYDPKFQPYEMPDEKSAFKFEKIVVKLPLRHREAFVMYWLHIGVERGRIVEVEDKQHMARILGVHVRMFEILNRQAHNMVLRDYQRDGK